MTASNPAESAPSDQTVPHDAPHDEHGSTPAAWTAVTIITLAFAVGTFAVVIANWPLFWVGVGLVVVGALVGRVMQAMGMGKKTPARKS
jgi:fatty acid desaturase